MEALFPFTLALIIFGLVLAIAWIILPFALIGTKPLLRQLLREQERTNELLSRATRTRDGQATPARVAAEGR